MQGLLNAAKIGAAGAAGLRAAATGTGARAGAQVLRPPTSQSSTFTPKGAPLSHNARSVAAASASATALAEPPVPPAPASPPRCGRVLAQRHGP